MRQISNTTRSNSSSQTSGQTGSFTDSYAGEGYQNIVEIANTVSLNKIFKLYGIQLDELNRKTTCPFKSHKGGREHTASFYYYPDTNTYCCFGCRQGSTCVDFVANMEKCDRIKAAKKILEKFQVNLDQEIPSNKEDIQEKIHIMMQYSDVVRNFRKQFSDEKSFYFIEDNCSTFDAINKKHDLNNEALKLVVDKLIYAINNYIP